MVRARMSPLRKIPNRTILLKETLTMQSRREMLKRSAGVAGLLAGLGLLPQAAQAAFNAAAFEAKSMADLV